MLQLNLPAFCLGVKEELAKQARCWEGYEPVPGKEPYSEDSCRPKRAKKKEKEKIAFMDINSMPVNENILPNISSQAKWKYVRTKDGLKLTDGNLVYSFGGFPENFPTEDTKVSRLSDDNILNFENDAISKGTAQIHRSSPDNLYLTLATGGDNPTFMLQHEEGKTWRYSPSKKFLAKLKAMQKEEPTVISRDETNSEKHDSSVLIDPVSLFQGMQDTVKKAFDLVAGEGLFHGAGDLANTINSAISGIGEAGRNFIADRAAHPVSSLVEGYVGGKLLNKIREINDPGLALQRKIDPKARTDREILPFITAAAPVVASRAISL